MNKKLSRGLAIILPNKKINTFVLFIIILGIISGAIFLTILKDQDKTLVIEKINTLFTNINKNNINNLDITLNTFIENIIFITIIWILGMSIIGIIINIFLLYLKGFIIGFTISSFLLVYKYKGLVAALIYVFPANIINIILYLLVGVYSIIFTINLWKTIFTKEREINMRKLLKKYIIIYTISIILIIISSLAEGYLIPSLLKLLIKVFI